MADELTPEGMAELNRAINGHDVSTDIIVVHTAKHGNYSAPAEKVSAMLVLFRGKGVREMRIDWCDITHTPEWIWADITDLATWAVMLAGRLDAPMYVRR